MTRRGVYPGSFNPLTVAHLAIAEEARRACRLDTVALVVSRVALGKPDVVRPWLEHRVEVLHRAAATRPWLRVVITDRQLLADIAAGYDVLVLGADKWSQVVDPSFYEDEPHRDAAVAALPHLAVVPRQGFPLPAGDATVLDLDLHHVSATAARRGERSFLSAEARAFDDETGAWSDQARYDAWVARHAPRPPSG